MFFFAFFSVVFNFFPLIFAQDSSLNRICAEKGEGPHPLAKCSPYYVQCGAAAPLIGFCEQPGHVFIPATPGVGAICGPPENSFECRKHWAIIRNFIDATKFCLENPYGIFPLAKCSPTFAVCHSGGAQILNCEQNEAFSLTYGHCVRRRESPECGQTSFGGINYDLLALQTFCAKNPNQIFPLSKNCKNQFLNCKNGESKVENCEPGMFFDWETRVCLAGGCGNSEIPQQILTYDTAFNQILHNLQFCNQKADGIYLASDNVCNREVAICSNEIPFSIVCGENEVFDADQIRCVQKTECQIETDSGSGSGSVSVSGFDSDSGLQRLSYDVCAMKGPGAHEISSCSNYFAICGSDGQNLIVPCSGQENSVFDQRMQKCVKVEEKEECAPPPPPAAPQAPDPARQCIPDSSIFREVAACSQSYQMCWNGILSDLACHESSVYDPNYKRCVKKEIARTCTPDVIPVNCKNQPEGKFLRDPLDCRIFYQCSHGDPIRKECGDGTVFDLSINVCNWSNNVLDCNSAIPVVV